MKYFIFTASLLLAAIFVVRSAAALETRWQATELVQARLLLAQDSVAPEQDTIEGLLVIRLQPDWYTYWRHPGDSGLPIRIDFEESENVSNVTIKWPAPNRYETLGLYGFGYKNQVSLPLDISMNDAGQHAMLSLMADIMVCKDICVPDQVNFEISIPVGDGSASKQAKLIEGAQMFLPAAKNNAHLKIESVIVGPDAVVVQAYSKKGFEGADLFVEARDLSITAKPEITVNKDDNRSAMIRVAAPENIDDLVSAVGTSPVTVTLTADNRALERIIDFNR